MRILLILFILPLIIACQKECYHPKGRYQKHVIKKGKHYSEGRYIKKTRCDSLAFNFYFDETVLEYGPDQINKIYGMSNTIDPRYASARIGWMCRDSTTIEIYAYVDSSVDGRYKRDYKLLTKIHPNDTVSAVIEDKGDYWLMSVDTEYAYEQVVIDKKRGKMFNIILWPYYGGQQRARKQIHVYIDS